jgi:hypothetical protein
VSHEALAKETELVHTLQGKIVAKVMPAQHMIAQDG